MEALDVLNENLMAYDGSSILSPNFIYAILSPVNIVRNSVRNIVLLPTKK
jgi:hypothetical protein